jgi:hypothetical protein
MDTNNIKQKNFVILISQLYLLLSDTKVAVSAQQKLTTGVDTAAGHLSKFPHVMLLMTSWHA